MEEGRTSIRVAVSEGLSDSHPLKVVGSRHLPRSPRHRPIARGLSDSTPRRAIGTRHLSRSPPAHLGYIVVMRKPNRWK